MANEKAPDIRIKRCIFTSHCLLAQGVMAKGLVRKFPALVKPIIQFCLDNDISIMQMPCPETICASGGLGRHPHSKEWYEHNGLRETAKEIADTQVKYMVKLLKDNFKIIAVVGVEFSPACAITYLNKGSSIYSDQGIYIEELKRKMRQESIDVPMIGISQRWHKKMLIDLQQALLSIEINIEPIVLRPEEGYEI